MCVFNGRFPRYKQLTAVNSLPITLSTLPSLFNTKPLNDANFVNFAVALCQHAAIGAPPLDLRIAGSKKPLDRKEETRGTDAIAKKKY